LFVVLVQLLGVEAVGSSIASQSPLVRSDRELDKRRLLSTNPSAKTLRAETRCVAAVLAKSASSNHNDSNDDSGVSLAPPYPHFVGASTR
jgi:hypothetical protein